MCLMYRRVNSETTPADKGARNARPPIFCRRTSNRRVEWHSGQPANSRRFSGEIVARLQTGHFVAPRGAALDELEFHIASEST